MDTKTYLTTSQVVARYPGGITASSVRRWCQNGTIPGAFTTPGGVWRIPASWLEDQLSPQLAS